MVDKCLLMVSIVNVLLAFVSSYICVLKCYILKYGFITSAAILNLVKFDRNKQLFMKKFELVWIFYVQERILLLVERAERISGDLVLKSIHLFFSFGGIFLLSKDRVYIFFVILGKFAFYNFSVLRYIILIIWSKWIKDGFKK